MDAQEENYSPEEGFGYLKRSCKFIMPRGKRALLFGN
jgi:hypothetical protein